MRIAFTILSLLFTLGLASPASQAGLLEFSVGPHVGVSHTNENEADTYLVGGSARLGILPALSAELAVDWRKEDVESGDVTTIPVQMSALLYLLPSIHLTGGLGWYAVDPNFDAVVGELRSFDDSASDAGIHLGVGLDLPVSESAKLTADIRYVFLGYELESAGETIEVDADFFMATAGVQFVLF